MSLEFHNFPYISISISSISQELRATPEPTPHLSVDALGQAWQAGHVFELLISGLRAW